MTPGKSGFAETSPQGTAGRVEVAANAVLRQLGGRASLERYRPFLLQPLLVLLVVADSVQSLPYCTIVKLTVLEVEAAYCALPR